MNFQQLRIIRETIRQSYNLTNVAAALSTSQSGVSKHIKDLEEELGVELFVRKGKRLLGLTDPGREIAEFVERILTDAANIRRVTEQMSQVDAGELVIATTHTQARYVLPPIVAAFRKMFPRVHLVLQQTSPAEIATLLLEGRADIGIATEALSQRSELAAFPFYSWAHTIVAPGGHPLLDLERPSLRDVARYPIITYHEGFTGRPAIDKAFQNAGVVPDIVMAALDADVIKAYVELGMGIGIVASMAVDPQRDTGLAVLPAQDLFPPSTSYIALRRGRFLRGFGYRFIEACKPELTEAAVRRKL